MKRKRVRPLGVWVMISTCLLVLTFSPPAEARLKDFFRVLGRVVRAGLEVGMGGFTVQAVYGVYKTARTHNEVKKECRQIKRDGETGRQAIENQARKDFEAGTINVRERNAEFARAARYEQTSHQLADRIWQVNDSRTAGSVLRQGAAITFRNVTRTEDFRKLSNGAHEALNNATRNLQSFYDAAERGKGFAERPFNRVIGEILDLKKDIEKARKALGEVSIRDDKFDGFRNFLAAAEKRLQQTADYVNERKEKAVDRLGIEKIKNEIKNVQDGVKKMDEEIRRGEQKLANMKPREYEHVGKFENNPRIKELMDKFSKLGDRASQSEVDDAANEALFKFATDELEKAGIKEDDPYHLEMALDLAIRASKDEFWMQKRRGELNMKDVIASMRKEIVAGSPDKGKEVATLVVSPKEIELHIGESKSFSATAVFTDGTTRNVTGSPYTSWLGADGNTFNAKERGPYTIKATYRGISGSAKIVVKKNPVKLYVTPKEKTVNIGEQVTLSCTAEFEDGSKEPVKAQWEPSNPFVGTEPRTYRITAHYGKLSDSATITVKQMTSTKSRAEDLFIGTWRLIFRPVSHTSPEAWKEIKETSWSLTVRIAKSGSSISFTGLRDFITDTVSFSGNTMTIKGRTKIVIIGGPTEYDMETIQLNCTGDGKSLEGTQRTQFSMLSVDPKTGRPAPQYQVNSIKGTKQ